jgi:hypothetical protein
LQIEHRCHAQALSAWTARQLNPQGLTDQMYSEKVQPLLAGMSSSAIASLALSEADLQTHPEGRANEDRTWMENAFMAYIPFIAYDEKNRKKFEGASRATPAFSAAFSFA